LRTPSCPHQIPASPFSRTSQLVMSNTAFIPCPHPSCSYAFPRIKGFQCQIRQHLSTLHTFDENQTLNHTDLHKLHCYPCTSCPLIFATLPKYQSHIQAAHPTTRTQTNLDIILRTYPGPPHHPQTISQHASTWQNTLLWLHTLHITPPTARSSLYTKLAPKQKQSFLHHLHHVITWCNRATLPISDASNLPSSLVDATPFWKLLLIFESITLAPLPVNTKAKPSYSNLLKTRLTLFRCGKIQELYQASRPSDLTPLPTPTIPVFDDTSYHHAAQQSADQDNLHTAYARLTSTAPNVTLTKHYLAILKALYPSPITFLDF
jgi:hypothetical protein